MKTREMKNRAKKSKAGGSLRVCMLGWVVPETALAEQQLGNGATVWSNGETVFFILFFIFLPEWFCCWGRGWVLLGLQI